MARVDFVWGNMPMQPDDERDGDGTATEVVAANAAQNVGWSGFSVWKSDVLDETKGNHKMATKKWLNFPANDRTAPFLDLVANATVPNVVGLTEAAANTALVAANLVKGTVTTTATGATALNDGKVKTQSVAAAAKVNEGTAVNLVLYAYTP